MVRDLEDTDGAGDRRVHLDRTGGFPLNVAASSRRLGLPFALLIGLVLSTPLRAASVELVGVHWGFDGNIVVGSFNPVRIEVRNPGAQPLVTRFELTATGSHGRRAPHVTSTVTLPAGESRVLSFVVRCAPEDHLWTLEAPRLNRLTIDLPSVGSLNRRAIVLLHDLTGGAPATSAVPAFPEQALPSNVGALDGLEAIVLDHDPAWGATRRQALDAWVRLGGRLEILRSPTGEFPALTGALAGLRSVAPGAVRYGAGQVRWHDLSARGLEAGRLPEEFRRPVKLEEPQEYRDLDAPVFQELASCTLPRHHWTVLTTLSLLYIALVGPLGWWFGRKVRNYLWSLSVCGAGIVLFSAIFFGVAHGAFSGRDGSYGLGYARVLDDGSMDLRLWSHLFVTRGRESTFAHPCVAPLYELANSDRALEASIRDGIDLRLDLPIFSTRQFHFRGTLDAPPLVTNLRVVREGSSWRLTGETTEHYPAEDGFAWFVVDEGSAEVRPSGGKLSAVTDGRKTSSLEPSDLQWFYNDWRRASGDIDADFPRAGRILAATVAGWVRDVAIPHWSPLPETARLMIFARAEQPSLEVEGLRPQTFYLLYDHAIAIEDENR